MSETVYKLFRAMFLGLMEKQVSTQIKHWMVNLEK